MYVCPKDDVSALSEKFLPDEVLKFISDIDCNRMLESYWRKLDRDFIPAEESKTRINLIRLFAQRNNNSL